MSAKFPLNFLIPIIHIFSIPPHSVCIFNLKSRPNFALLSQIPVFKYDESYCKRSQCNLYKNAIINSYSFLAHPRYVSSQLEDSIASLSGLICTYLPPFPSLPFFIVPFAAGSVRHGSHSDYRSVGETVEFSLHESLNWLASKSPCS